MWNASLFEGLSLQHLQSLSEQLRESSKHLKYDSSLAAQGSRHIPTNTKAVVRDADEDKVSLASTEASEVGEDAVLIELVSQKNEMPKLLSCEASSALSLAPDHRDGVARVTELVPRHSETLNQQLGETASALSLAPGHTDNMSREVQIESSSDRRTRVTWVVEAKKLSTKDQQIISPMFEISKASFRIMLKPKSMGAKKGQTTFKKAGGKGSVALKLVESMEPVPRWHACAAVGACKNAKIPRGHVEHNFTEGSLCSLGDDWDFGGAVDSQTSTFVVSIDISPKDGWTEA